jgi:hypothetical protein
MSGQVDNIEAGGKFMPREITHWLIAQRVAIELQSSKLSAMTARHKFPGAQACLN